jgi:hypothetical protein
MAPGFAQPDFAVLTFLKHEDQEILLSRADSSPLALRFAISVNALAEAAAPVKG